MNETSFFWRGWLNDMLWCCSDLQQKNKNNDQLDESSMMSMQDTTHQIYICSSLFYTETVRDRFRVRVHQNLEKLRWTQLFPFDFGCSNKLYRAVPTSPLIGIVDYLQHFSCVMEVM
jgi:hypothetical protein